LQSLKKNKDLIAISKTVSSIQKIDSLKGLTNKVNDLKNTQQVQLTNILQPRKYL